MVSNGMGSSEEKEGGWRSRDTVVFGIESMQRDLESGEGRAESDGGDRVCTKSTAVLFLFVPLIVDQDLTS